jgi:hypothetical protein
MEDPSMKPGDRVKVPFYAEKLALARDEDWVEAILLRFDDTVRTYDSGVTLGPMWQVRIDAPGRGAHRWLVSVDPACIRPIS